MTSSSVLHSLLFLTFTIPLMLLLSTNFATTTIAKPQRLVIKLIHRDSILSPFYNPNDTLADRAARYIEISISRNAYLQAQNKRTFPIDHDVRANLLFNTHNFLFTVNFSIGQPPIPQQAFMDTGSNLIWIQCVPCRCFKQSSPIFNPSKSSTFDTMSCDSESCEHYSFNLDNSCDLLDNCMYFIKYADGTSSAGILATEQLIFETSDEAPVIVPNVVFGCSHQNKQTSEEQSTGIFGVGPSSLLVSALGNKFSYCIGSITDPNYSYNHLILGDGAIIEGYSTPFEVYKRHYYITMEGISIGEKRLKIDPSIFRMTTSGSGGVIIDSGTPVSWLPEGAYQILSNEVQDLLNGLLTRAKNDAVPSQLCYKGIISRDLSGFPVVTFHFAEGADLVLDTESMFMKTNSNAFCMAVVPNNSSDTSSQIGMMAQQYYNVGYDLNENRIYFQRIDCELLDD